MNAARTLLGVLLIGLGLLVVVGNVGPVDAGDVVRRGWPVLVIALGALQLWSDGRVTAAGLGIVLVGVALLGATTGLLGGAADAIGPLVLVGVGIWVALGLRRRGEPITAGERARALAAFGVRRVRSTSERFAGGWAASFFGQLDLDLTRATPAPGGIDLSVTAVLGGADVVIPEGWAVRIRGLPLFGTWDDTTSHVPPGDGVPELRMNAVAAFGGIEVRHRDRWA